jgi:hypothetical protein
MGLSVPSVAGPDIPGVGGLVVGLFGVCFDTPGGRRRGVPDRRHAVAGLLGVLRRCRLLGVRGVVRAVIGRVGRGLVSFLDCGRRLVVGLGRVVTLVAVSLSVGILQGEVRAFVAPLTAFGVGTPSPRRCRVELRLADGTFDQRTGTL